MTETETVKRETVKRDRWVDVGGLFVGLAAAVSSWAGWVGLATTCGWTETWTIPLPGVETGLTVRLAWLAAVMVDVYAVVAFRVWLRSAPWVSQATRTFARRSTLLALTLGVLGNVAYHLMASWNVQKAPALIVILFSSLAPIMLGAVAHLISVLTQDQMKHETVPTQVSPVSVQVSPAKEQVKSETRKSETVRPAPETVKTQTQVSVSPVPAPRPQTQTQETAQVSSLPARSQSRDEQLALIKSHAPDWAERGGAVSDKEITEATGITGKQTLVNLRKILKAEAASQPAPELTNAI